MPEYGLYGLSKPFNHLSILRRWDMALYTTLPVYHDCYNLTLMLFRYTKEFPREYKYTLGQDIKHDSIAKLRLNIDTQKHFVVNYRQYCI